MQEKMDSTPSNPKIIKSIEIRLDPMGAVAGDAERWRKFFNVLMQSTVWPWVYVKVPSAKGTIILECPALGSIPMGDRKVYSDALESLLMSNGLLIRKREDISRIEAEVPLGPNTRATVSTPYPASMLYGAALYDPPASYESTRVAESRYKYTTEVHIVASRTGNYNLRAKETMRVVLFLASSPDWPTLYSLRRLNSAMIVCWIKRENELPQEILCEAMEQLKSILESNKFVLQIQRVDSHVTYIVS